MMFFLMLNVMSNVRSLGFADGESRVSALPMKVVQVREVLFEPNRAPFFDVLDDGFHGVILREREENMSVINVAADDDCRRIPLLQNTRLVGPESLLDLGIENRDAMLRGIDEVHEIADERLRHDCCALTGRLRYATV